MFLRFKASLLSIITLGALAAAMASPATAQGHGENSPDVTEIRQYRLTMAKVDQYITASTALKKYVDTHPELGKRMNSGDSDNESISQKAADLDLHFPEAAVVLRSNGFATREYLVMSLALLNDIMIVGMKKQGALKEYPPKSITAENAAFVEQNYDKLAQALSSLQPKDSGQQ